MMYRIPLTNLIVIMFLMVAVLFLGAYFYGWYENATTNNKYDLQGLVDTAKWTLSQFIVLFSSHSLLNTPIPGISKEDVIK